ncbi:complex I NDUFA9 subunit family protein [Thalassovita sp.]|uniref:complex I NDUFA9 subunit family protein n=1 Tax=Thalassovita sp. TaxID=1979401 RepID=UPI00288145E0|nr:complex I NDUFA9 subunit family protein [Thalassovita sp.]MDF1802477.1 complex I NDUFA9 subunit family protein [Thalassovita sp.]
MSKLVTIYGGAGFVGRYIARRLAKDGWRVRVAVRHPNEAMHVKPYGVPGQVEPVLCNIRDDNSVRSVMQGADAVVNCVGLMHQLGKNTFDAVQSEGAGRIARIAAEQGVGTMVHLSAIGADAESESEYAQTKAQGEEAVLAHMPGAVILRPSVIFGSEDQFYNRFAGMMGPILPVVGADIKFQPVYVEDVARAAVMGVEGTAPAGIYELGGPEVRTFRALMEEMLTVTHRRKLIVNLPYFVASGMAFGFDLLQKLTGGLFKSALTRDQVKALKSDNVVSEDAKSFADLGIKPAAPAAILPDYLWRFRPSGQYAAIKDSAKGLRIN